MLDCTGHWEYSLQRYFLSSTLLLCFCFLFTSCSMLSVFYLNDILSFLRYKSDGASWPWIETFETLEQNKSIPPFKLSPLLRVFTDMESWVEKYKCGRRWFVALQPQILYSIAHLFREHSFQHLACAKYKPRYIQMQCLC